VSLGTGVGGRETGGGGGGAGKLEKSSKSKSSRVKSSAISSLSDGTGILGLFIGFGTSP